jgi:exonuclease SbcD
VFSKPGVLKLQTKNGPVQIVGIPWPTRNNLLTLDDYRHKDCEQIVLEISSQVAVIIKNFAASLDPSVPAILASHLTVTTGVFSGSEKTAIIGSDPILMPSQLAIEPFNYVALGHLHRHQNLAESGAIPIVYSGSIEAIDFGELRDKKGYCLVKIDTKPNSCGGFVRSSEMLFVPISTRKMVELKVDVGVGLEQTERLAKAIMQENVVDAIVKIAYTLPPGAVDCVDMFRIQELLKPAIYVVSIRAVKVEITRRVRANVENCQDLNTLLKKYLNDKHLEARIPELFRKAEEIICCIDTKDQD